MIELPAKPVSGGGMLLAAPDSMGRYLSTDVLSKRQEISQLKGREVFARGGFQDRDHREARGGAPFACWRTIEIAPNGRTTALDLQYRDFGRYVVDYIEAQEAKCNIDQQEAINCLMHMQAG